MIRCCAALLLLVTATARAGGGPTLVITEFLNDPRGADATDEWVELYNYGPTDIDLSGFTIADMGSDDDPIGGIIPAGDFIILAKDAATFTTIWGVGTPGVDVVDVPGLVLSNSGDELVLLDLFGIEIWSLAYDNDESAGRATYLTIIDDYTVRSHGTDVSPGVVRNGDDNGMPGYLGYESNSATPDPFSFTSSTNDQGSPLAGQYLPLYPSSDPTLTITGACPGISEVNLTGLTPYGNFAVLTASGPGTAPITAGPCSGAMTDLDAFTFRGLFGADAVGAATLTPTLNPGACGLSVQMLDVTTCALTNVDLVP